MTKAMANPSSRPHSQSVHSEAGHRTLAFKMNCSMLSSWLSELFATQVGYAHGNSAASENVAGARKPSVHADFIFVSKTVGQIRAFFVPMTKMQLKRVNHKLSRRTVDAPSTGHAREASNGPEKSLVQHGLVEKKRQISWLVESLRLQI